MNEAEEITKQAYEWVRSRAPDKATAPSWERLPGPDRRGFVLMVSKAIELSTLMQKARSHD